MLSSSKAVHKGAAAATMVAPIIQTKESHIHLLHHHQVLLIHERLQIFDGYTGNLSDVNPFSPPDGHVQTVAAPAGDMLVVWSARQAVN